MWHIENYFQEDNLLSIWPNMDPKCENHKEMKEKNLLLPFSDIYDAYINLLKEKVEKGEEVGSIPAAFVLAEAEQARAVYQKEVLGEKK